MYENKYVFVEGMEKIYIINVFHKFNTGTHTEYYLVKAMSSDEAKEKVIRYMDVRKGTIEVIEIDLNRPYYLPKWWKWRRNLKWVTFYIY